MYYGIVVSYIKETSFLDWKNFQTQVAPFQKRESSPFKSNLQKKNQHSPFHFRATSFVSWKEPFVKKQQRNINKIYSRRRRNKRYMLFFLLKSPHNTIYYGMKKKDDLYNL